MKLHEIAGEPIVISLAKKLLAAGERVELYAVARRGPRWVVAHSGTITKLISVNANVIVRFVTPGSAESWIAISSSTLPGTTLKKVDGVWRMKHNSWWADDDWKKAHPEET
jgi:hypothetical protein